MEEILNQLYEEIGRFYAQRDFEGLEKYLIVKLRENAQSCIACYNPFEVTILNELGTLYRGLGRQEEAIQMFESAAAIIEERLGTANEEYATAVNNLAGAYRLNGQTDAAVKSFQKAMEIYEKCGSQRTYLYSSAENNLGLVYLGIHNAEAAEECFLDALQIVENLREESDEFAGDLAVTYVNLASAKYLKKEWQHAEKYCTRALEEYDSVPENQQNHKAAAYNLLGDIYRVRSCPEQAKAYYRNALEWTERFFGKNYEYQRLEEKITQL